MGKIALIIGNGAYPDEPLKNPCNDADSISSTLRTLGFLVHCHKDLTNKEMDSKLAEFADLLNDHEVALIFFAGHGMQINGANYLTAVDTDFSNEVNTRFSSLELDKIIDYMDGASNKTNIIMLDACRNNRYSRSWRGGSTSNLAPVYAPRGMIICYATSPGQVASDGRGDNGAYTSAFLQHVSTPNLPIEDVFKRVRKTLSSITRDKQISWEHTSLMGDFYFCHNMLTDELIPSYSKQAFSDKNYEPFGGNAVEIITALKSHNWYIQNRFAQRIKQSELKECTIDDLFVLGRNLYQAACGNATDILQIIKRYNETLKNLDESISYHLLNGAIYEIYFDSGGNLRKRFKATCFEEILRLEMDDHFSESMKFIQQALQPVRKEIFYLPGSKKPGSLDVIFKTHSSGKQILEAINFEGSNILYDTEGKSYYDCDSDEAPCLESIQNLNDEICKMMLYPSRLLTINHIGLSDPSNPILKPVPLVLKMT